MAKAVKKPVIPFVAYYLKKYVRAGDAVLDVGCGTAQYRDSAPCKYIGLDSAGITTDGLNMDVDLIAMATDIPLENDSCDLVFSVAAFYQVADTGKALSEFLRILKPSGRLIIFDYNKRAQQRLEKKEGAERPCWTQRRLKEIVSESGFKQCEILLPVVFELGGVAKDLIVPFYEIFREWAIVTGVK
ncbi:MAG: class I SAM-dependent methyltransferase [Candidatus Omnitrophota bacterium]